METILSISYIFAQLSAKESLWWILPKSLSPRSVEILKVDLNGKHYHFPLPDCRRQPRGWVWKKPGLYPRSCEGNYLLLTSHYCFQLKAIRELFFLWANTRGVLGCQGRDQILLLFFHLSLADDAAANSLVRKPDRARLHLKKWLGLSPASHCWGHCPRPCNLQIRGGTCWWGCLHSRTAA